MSFVNSLLRTAFDGLLFPFRGLEPIWGLLAVSLASAVGMLAIFKATSNQKALERVKRQIHACLFEIRLWNDDMRAIFRAQAEILWRNLAYLRYSLVPMVWIIVPLFFVVAQLQFHYGYEGLEVGDATLLEVTLEPGSVTAGAPKPEARLAAPPGLAVETPAVWSAANRQLTWRLRAVEEGEFELGVELAGETYSKTVVVAADVRRRSPNRVVGFVNQLIYPAEAPLPAGGPVATIEIAYPDRSVSLLGWQSHWLVHFFILTIFFAFLLRKPMGVTI